MLHIIIIILSSVLYSRAFFVEEQIKGVNWVGSSEITEESLKSLDRIHVNWIIQTPFAWQKRYNMPELRLNTRHVLWGESDEGIRVTSAYAKKRNLKIMLKPHIWLLNYSGKWRSDIRMENEKDWDLWFKNYEKVIVHYANLAKELEIDALCIGTELFQTVRGHNEKWVNMIKKVKMVYPGKLTYAANWYKEYEDVKFWNELDFIGIQAYFPLGTSENPTITDINEAWSGYKKKISVLANSLSKKVIFTELGYKNMLGTTIRPWEWPEKISGYILDEELQSRAFESFFQSFWDETWFAGVFIWKWYPHEPKVFRNRLDFSPQKKKAEAVIAEWFQIKKL